MAPADFEFFIKLMGSKTVKKDTTYRAAVPVEERHDSYTAVFGYRRLVHQPAIP
jgi:hypothetical protein